MRVVQSRRLQRAPQLRSNGSRVRLSSRAIVSGLNIQRLHWPSPDKIKLASSRLDEVHVEIMPILTTLRTTSASAALVSLLCLSSLPAVAQALPGLPPLRKAPELAFKLPGGEQKMLSQYRGKVVALEFILTTCPHCQVASRVLTKLQGELGSKGFQALDVAVNTTDEALIKQFIANQQVGFPVGWIDTGSPMNNVMALMNFMGMTPNDRPQMPQQVLIDREGMIRYQTPPASDLAATEEPALRARVLELLGQPGSAKPKAATGHSK